MAKLSELCVIPAEWDGAAKCAGKTASGNSGRKEDARQRRKEAYAEREVRRMVRRQRAFRTFMRETGTGLQRIEGTREIVAVCKGERAGKRVKNGFSKEQAGTVGNMIVTRRFNGSRLTCVCKTRKY